MLPSVERCEELLGELVRRRSPSGREEEVQRYIAGWLEERGIPVSIQELDGGLLNVVARLEGAGSGPVLLLCGHSDTALPVEGWETDPFSPTRRGDRLYGLGAMDMKAGLAAAMLTMEALAQTRHQWHGTVLFAAVADEEAWSRGAKGLLAAGLKADAAILCEPEFDAPWLGAVGKVLLRVEVIGRAAHGSFPEQGINAVVEAGRLLAVLDEVPMGEHPAVGRGSQCVLGIQGGPAEYVIQVPERCLFTINRHIVPGETGEMVIRQMEELASSLHSPATFRFSIEPPYYPPFVVDREEPLVQRFSEAHEAVLGRAPTFAYGRGVCDGNYLVADAGIPTVVFGPSGRNLHSANEWADLTQIPQAVAVYLRLADSLLKGV